MRPNFGPDDNDHLIKLAHGAHVRGLGALETPIRTTDEAVEFRGEPGRDVAYVRLTWARVLGDPAEHKVYRATRDAAGRVRLRLLEHDAYSVTRNGELRLRSAAGAAA